MRMGVQLRRNPFDNNGSGDGGGSGYSNDMQMSSNNNMVINTDSSQ